MNTTHTYTKHINPHENTMCCRGCLCVCVHVGLCGLAVWGITGVWCWYLRYMGGLVGGVNGVMVGEPNTRDPCVLWWSCAKATPPPPPPATSADAPPAFKATPIAGGMLSPSALSLICVTSSFSTRPLRTNYGLANKPAT